MVPGIRLYWCALEIFFLWIYGARLTARSTSAAEGGVIVAWLVRSNEDINIQIGRDQGQEMHGFDIS